MMLLLALACAASRLDNTAVSDLQVIGAEVDPPGLLVDSPLILHFAVANPLRRPARLLVWSCIDAAQGACAEDQGTPLGARIAMVEAPSATTPVTLLPLSTDDEAVIAAIRRPVVSVWSLLCEVDACPFFDRVEAALAAEAGPTRRLLADLADPTRLLDEIPVGRGALGLRNLPLLDPEDPEHWNENPQLWMEPPRPAAGYAELDRGAILDLFLVGDDQRGQGLLLTAATTGGTLGFDHLDGPTAALRLTAPSQPATFTVYGIVTDTLGGQTIEERVYAVR